MDMPLHERATHSARSFSDFDYNNSGGGALPGTGYIYYPQSQLSMSICLPHAGHSSTSSSNFYPTELSNDHPSVDAYTLRPANPSAYPLLPFTSIGCAPTDSNANISESLDGCLDPGCYLHNTAIATASPSVSCASSSPPVSQTHRVHTDLAPTPSRKRRASEACDSDDDALYGSTDTSLEGRAAIRLLRIEGEQRRRDDMREALRRLRSVLPMDTPKLTKVSLISSATTHIRYLELNQQRLQTRLKAAEAEVLRLRDVSEAIMLGVAEQKRATPEPATIATSGTVTDSAAAAAAVTLSSSNTPSAPAIANSPGVADSESPGVAAPPVVADSLTVAAPPVVANSPGVAAPPVVAALPAVITDLPSAASSRAADFPPAVARSPRAAVARPHTAGRAPHAASRAPHAVARPRAAGREPHTVARPRAAGRAPPAAACPPAVVAPAKSAFAVADSSFIAADPLFVVADAMMQYF